MFKPSKDFPFHYMIQSPQSSVLLYSFLPTSRPYFAPATLLTSQWLKHAITHFFFFLLSQIKGFTPLTLLSVCLAYLSVKPLLINILKLPHLQLPLPLFCFVFPSQQLSPSTVKFFTYFFLIVLIHQNSNPEEEGGLLLFLPSFFPSFLPPCLPSFLPSFLLSFCPSFPFFLLLLLQLFFFFLIIIIILIIVIFKILLHCCISSA